MIKIFVAGILFTLAVIGAIIYCGYLLFIAFAKNDLEKYKKDKPLDTSKEAREKFMNGKFMNGDDIK